MQPTHGHASGKTVYGGCGLGGADGGYSEIRNQVPPWHRNAWDVLLCPQSEVVPRGYKHDGAQDSRKRFHVPGPLIRGS